MKYIKFFKEVSIKDAPLVGGKNAALGEMYQNLVPLGVPVPNGFAVTSEGYDYFIKSNNLEEKIKEVLKDLDTHNIEGLHKKGEEIRSLIRNGNFSEDLKNEILSAFNELKKEYGENFTVAVRSSATAEDLPDASFAGQQETYLNVNEDNLLQRIKDCFASLFTDRAISYREDKKFDHFQVKLSVGVQKMVRSDLASSGVMFTIDPDSGLKNVIVINSVLGLGELIVQGKIVPDEFIVFKNKNKNFPLIFKKLGAKTKKIIYGEKETEEIETKEEERKEFSLTDDEVRILAEYAFLLENHFAKAMDIEWAKDGIENKLYIVQARPETVYSTKTNVWYEYRLKEKKEPILKGIAIGNQITSGKVRVIKDASKINEFRKEEILVTEMTDPDWEPIMKMAKGIVTEKGGRTCHAAIVSRELGVPAIVGVSGALEKLKTGDEITIDNSSGLEGKIYEGALAYESIEHKVGEIPETKTKVYVNIGEPDEAWERWYLPIKGVGLAREEFIIASEIDIHPNALLDYENLPEDIKQEIDKKTKDYQDKKQFYIDKLSQGIAKIAVSFWPKEVIMRFSDFKTNEYRNLLGGEIYEPKEENPMIGWRGASRYYHPKFLESFKLEVLAVKKVREEIGLENVSVMVPFCRTPQEGKKIVDIINSLIAENRPKIYVMCEIPSNVLLVDEFLEIFDGMSIGSNDLTQLVLGIDRDNEVLTGIGDERNKAVLKMIEIVIKKCKEKGKYVGICGQAPSDFPEIVKFLVENNIDSISVNPDVVFKTIEMVASFENEDRAN